MPFGLDLKSIIVGIILAMFVWPFAMQLFASLTSKNKSTSAPRTV